MQAPDTVEVGARIASQITAIHIKDGQMVKAGDLLAEIDPRTYQVQVAQAQGQLAKDQALLANARVDLQRYQTLLAQDSIAKQQVDTQEALVRQYQGTIEADQGAVDSAKLQLSFTRITAPIAGRVGLRQVDPGNMMTTMAALLGALPLMLGWGVGSELRHPLGIAMVGGLILSQVLTLFTTPVIYLAFDDLARRVERWRAARNAPQSLPASGD